MSRLPNIKLSIMDAFPSCPAPRTMAALDDESDDEEAWKDNHQALVASLDVFMRGDAALDVVGEALEAEARLEDTVPRTTPAANICCYLGGVSSWMRLAELHDAKVSAGFFSRLHVVGGLTACCFAAPVRTRTPHVHVWLCVMPVSGVGAARLAAVGPHLGKLVRMQMLNLEGMRALWLRVKCCGSLRE